MPKRGPLDVYDDGNSEDTEGAMIVPVTRVRERGEKGGLPSSDSVVLTFLRPTDFFFSSLSPSNLWRPILFAKATKATV